MKNLTVITLNQPDIADFAAARNVALAAAKTEWVMFVDQDEKVTKALVAEVEKAISSDKYDAYYVKRQDYFLGRKLEHGETANVSLVRLARKEYGKWVRPVHEIWVGEGGVGRLHNPLIHYSHNSISTFLSKINVYSTFEAEYRFKNNARSSLFHIAFYPLGKFVKNYVVLQGFRDGVPGMIMAIMMSLHSFLTWTKLYLLWHKK